MLKAKKILPILSMLLLCTFGQAQTQSNYADSLRIVLKRHTNDTIQVKTMIKLGYFYWRASETDSALNIANSILQLSEKLGFNKGKIQAYDIMGEVYFLRHEEKKSLPFFFKSLEIATKQNDLHAKGYAYRQIGWSYEILHQTDLSVKYWKKSLKCFTDIHDTNNINIANYHLVLVYGYLNNITEVDRYLADYLKLVELSKNKKKIADGKMAFAYVLMSQNRFLLAQSYLFEALKIYQALKDKGSSALCLESIGNILSDDNYEKKMRLFKEAYALRAEIGDSLAMARSSVAIGYLLASKGEINAALKRYYQALNLYKESDAFYGGKPMCLTAIANAKKQLADIELKNGDDQNAEVHYSEAIKYHLEALHEWQKTEALHIYGSAESNKSIGDIYLKLKNYNEALKYLNRAFNVAENEKQLSLITSSSYSLYSTYDALGNTNQALFYLKKYSVSHDSLEIILSKTEMIKAIMNFDFKKTEALQQEEQLKKDVIAKGVLKQQKTIRNAILVGLALVLLFSLLLLNRFNVIRSQKRVIEKEKERSEELLLNILPEEIAQELKEKGQADARNFDMVSILFTDFKGFTQASAKLSAQDLVAEINTCFEAFDGIMEKYGIEKIKTIGDAYMAAGGLPVPTDASTKNTVLAALEMQAFIDARLKTKETRGEQGFEMRVGIHTGPVVAGIVGVKKFQYDIWGDTVNTASRMESNGEVGKINISQATYEHLKQEPEFTFENRGKIKAKGKGEIEMYFVSKT